MAAFPKNKARGRSSLPFKIRVRQMTGVIIVVLLLLGFVRVGYIIAFHGDEYRSQAEANQLYDTVLRPIRGTIYDCNNNEMVTSASAYILCAAPKSIYNYFYNNVTDPDTVLKAYTKELGTQIAKTVGMKKKEVIRMLRDYEKSYVRIKKKVDANQRLSLDAYFAESYTYGVNAKGKELKVRNRAFFSYESDSLRLYPENNFASTVIGVTDADGNGITGVEKYYNETLSGKAGRIVTARNANGQSLDSSYETIFNAQAGNGIVMTIDQNIQHYLENALTTALDTTKAKGVYGIVMDVHTGAVKAISDKPDFDLNNPRELLDPSAIKELEEYKGTDEYNQKLSEKLMDQWNSFCITSTYEPGSTFKIFTAAAALEEGKVDLNTTYTCTGAYQVADAVIHCANTAGHGTQTLTQGLMNSCNPFFISIGQKLGKDTFNKYFEAFGFTERTGIDLTGEAYPVYHAFDKMTSVDLASTSFGQSFRVSPIQMITAGCAIANGGKLMTPYIVDSVLDENGNVITKTEPTVKRQVISEGTAATVRQMMEAVVEGGTGKNAYIEGYRLAGKTATSEKLDAEGGADQLLYIASFLCFAPANDPQVAVLVGVDEPPGNYRGGGVLAAPIAKEVMESTLKYMNVEPQYTAEELKKVSRTTPSLIGETLAAARSKAQESQLTLRIIGNGEKVVSQVPTAGQSISENGVIVVYTENAEAQKVEVPSFIGMTASSVKQEAAACGLNVTFSGPADTAGATAVKQSIAEGIEVQAGSTVTVQFQATANMND